MQRKEGDVVRSSGAKLGNGKRNVKSTLNIVDHGTHTDIMQEVHTRNERNYGTFKRIVKVERSLYSREWK